MNGRAWTQQDDEVIRNLYPFGNSLVEQLGRSRTAIRTRAQRLGISLLPEKRKKLHTTFPMGKEWTQQDDAMLHKHFPQNVPFLRTQLDRSAGSIYQRARRIGISAPELTERRNRKNHQGIVDPIMIELRRYRRDVLKWTLGDASKASGHSRQAITNWEFGRSQPTLVDVRALSAAMGFEIDIAPRGHAALMARHVEKQRPKEFYADTSSSPS